MRRVSQPVQAAYGGALLWSRHNALQVKSLKIWATLAETNTFYVSTVSFAATVVQGAFLKNVSSASEVGRDKSHGQHCVAAVPS